MKEKEMPRELRILQTHCIFCHHSTMMFCGGWIARTGGCCVGAEYEGTRYLIPLTAHIQCIVKHKGKIKTWYSEDELKKFVREAKDE